MPRLGDFGALPAQRGGARDARRTLSICSGHGADDTLTVTGTSNASNVDTLDYASCVDGDFMIVTPTTPATTILAQTEGTIILRKQP